LTSQPNDPNKANDIWALSICFWLILSRKKVHVKEKNEVRNIDLRKHYSDLYHDDSFSLAKRFDLDKHLPTEIKMLINAIFSVVEN